MIFTIYLSGLLVLLFVYLWKRKQFKHNYPPGLPAWPIVGSVPYLTKNNHLHYSIQEWGKQYGQVFSGSSFKNTPLLFVTGADNVLAALRKEEFQGRPDTATIRSRANDLDKKSPGIFFSDGHQWAESRKFSMRQIRSFGAVQVEQFMTKEVNALNDSIKDGSVMEATGLFALSTINVIWLIIANKTFDPDNEKIRIFISENKTFFRAGNPAGASLADILPVLGKLFDKPFRERVRHIRETHRLIKELIDEHRQILDLNNPFDLIDNYLVEMEKRKGDKDSTYSETDLCTICFDLFSAGAEPTVAALDFVLLYMVLYPEVQKKMQDEIDTVLAKARAPNLEDRNRLPYTMAVLNEVSRINPTAPIVVPHRCTKDTHFNNYFVEKDTTIIMDLHSVGFDPKYWENPDDFLPERFLDGTGNLKKNLPFYPFGVGQRVCVGEFLAKNLVFLFITTFFEKYTLSLPKGEPKPTTEALSGFTTAPHPFKALVTSRY